MAYLLQGKLQQRRKDSKRLPKEKGYPAWSRNAGLSGRASQASSATDNDEPPVSLNSFAGFVSFSGREDGAWPLEADFPVDEDVGLWNPPSAAAVSDDAVVVMGSSRLHGAG